MRDVAELFDALLGGADLPAMVAGPDGRVIAANAAFARRLGRPEDWRPDGPVRDLLGAELHAPRDAAAACILADPTREIAIQGPFRDADGAAAPMVCRLSALRLGGRCAAVLHRLEPAAPEADRLARLESLFDGAPVALFEYHVDAQGETRIPYFNDPVPALFGVTAEELAEHGPVLFRNVPQEDMAAITAAIVRTQETLENGIVRYRVQHPTRGLRHIIGEGTPQRLPDDGVVWRCVALDVTATHEAELRAKAADAALARAHERLERIARIAPVGLYEFQLAEDGSWRFPYLSPSMRDLMGIDEPSDASETSSQLAAERVFERIAPEDAAGVTHSIAESTRTLQRWNHRLRVDHPQRGRIWLRGESTPSTGPDGEVTWTGALYDVTEDVRREAELAAAHARADAMRAENERQALQDGLTGLPNRRAYDRALAARIDAARDGSGPRDALLVRLDLDHFKNVNDTMGHAAGDLVLQHVARALRGGLRNADFVSRIGGDEFSMLLAPGATTREAEAIVERVRDLLAEPLHYEGRPCRFGASFGLARTDDLAGEGMELQVFADAALYRAKQGGRSRLEVFTPELHRGILSDRRLAVQIQDAIERDEFVPYFQPQIDARDRSLYGAEVLLRWRRPHGRVLSPPQFLRVADQLHLAPRIDRRLMERTREVLDRWRADGFVAPRLSFNMSAGRIRDPDVVETSQLLVAGPTRIAMELLESSLIEEESDLFRFNLDRIREAGIEIEIDDFGSGHASIVGLTHVTPDALKIDRRLVDPVAVDPRARDLIRAILEIARTLGISTVAEGVETEAQAQVLSELGCDVLQGFHFGVPMDESAFLRFARRWETRVA